MRQCGSCTKCCEGWVTGEIRLRPMYPGKPCYLLQLNKGCEQYDSRPEHPCKVYQCGWSFVDDIPDQYKPDACGVIINVGQIQGFSFFAFINSPETPSEEMLQWFIEYSNLRNINLIWTQADGLICYYGQQEFCDTVAAVVSPLSTKELEKLAVYTANN